MSFVAAGLNTSGLSAPLSALTPATAKTPLSGRSGLASPNKLYVKETNKSKHFSPSKFSQSDSSILSLHNAKTPSKNPREGHGKTPSKSAPNTPHQGAGDRSVMWGLQETKLEINIYVLFRICTRTHFYLYFAAISNFNLKYLSLWVLTVIGIFCRVKKVFFSILNIQIGILNWGFNWRSLF